MDFEIVKKAGMTQAELAYLAGVSRTTANSWLNGGRVHSLISSKISRILAAITKAVEAKELPLPADSPTALWKGKPVRAALRRVVAHHAS